MKINGKQISDIVSLCWKVASNAPMEGVPVGMALPTPDSMGNQIYQMARYETYKMLLCNMIPNHAIMQQEGKFETQINREKETWEE